MSVIGSPLGWRGPWGTTYPPNRRLFIPTMSGNEWVTVAKTTKLRPPMPWFALHEMSKSDLRAIYRFVRYLGPAGKAAPAFFGWFGRRKPPRCPARIRLVTIPFPNPAPERTARR